MTHFFYNASYTYPKLFGNWSGLANSDEAGRSDPNVSRAFDLSPGNFDENGHNVYGRLGHGSAAQPEAVRQLRARVEARDDHARRLAAGLQRHATELGGDVHRAGASTTAAVISGGRLPSPRPTCSRRTPFGFGGNKRMVFEAMCSTCSTRKPSPTSRPGYNRNGSVPQALTSGPLRRNDRRRDSVSSASHRGVAELQPDLQPAPGATRKARRITAGRPVPVLGTAACRPRPAGSKAGGAFSVPEGLKAEG